jgi:hypothetical protein
MNFNDFLYEKGQNMNTNMKITNLESSPVQMTPPPCHRCRPPTAEGDTAAVRLQLNVAIAIAACHNYLQLATCHSGIATAN